VAILRTLIVYKSVIVVVVQVFRLMGRINRGSRIRGVNVRRTIIVFLLDVTGRPKVPYSQRLVGTRQSYASKRKCLRF